MEVELTSDAQEDLDFWKSNNNISVLKKIRSLIVSIQNTPFQGIGKPEPLKYEFSGKWCRRITKEHRLIYSVENETIYIFSLRGHYH